MPLIASLLIASVLPVVADKATHSVTFTARATDIDVGTTVEFLFVGPDSDRAYEALFVTDASVQDIAKAFDEAGIPRGKAISPAACRFWPVGNVLKFDPDIAQYMDDREGGLNQAIVYTGGLRDVSDIPIANTNMPKAVFALYGLDQSLILLDNTLDQSAAYGLFTCRKKLTAGERHTFKVSWDGVKHIESRTLLLKPGRVRDAVASLKGATRPLEVQPNFSPELTVAEARSAAKALSVVNSPSVRISGFSDGQIYYQGFLPDEQWRDRQKRITQPLEVRLDATNAVLTVIEEDWSVEGDDPKLTPRTFPLADGPFEFKGDTCLFFVPASERLGRIYSLMRKFPRNIRNWYVFID